MLAAGFCHIYNADYVDHVHYGGINDCEMKGATAGLRLLVIISIQSGMYAYEKHDQWPLTKKLISEILLNFSRSQKCSDRHGISVSVHTRSQATWFD